MTISSGWAKPAAISLAAISFAGLTSCQSVDNVNFYRQHAEAMTLSGHYRQDVAPEDAPYDSGDLARNFTKVAFVPEAQLAWYYRDRAEGPRRLSKWLRPIRYRMVGDGVRPDDRADLADTAARLAGHASLSIAPVEAGERPTLTVYVLTPEARGNLARLAMDPMWSQNAVLRSWSHSRTPCFALFETDHIQGGEILNGAIFIKAEIEGPLRRSCFVEEFAQMLGLLFDHGDVRPSIFNDDQEFLELTRHDGELVEILYDPRLAPGMTEVEATPIVAEIVAERDAR